MLFRAERLARTFAFAFLLCSCASVNYDEQADKQLTDITQEVNQQFITWEDQAKTKSVPYDSKYYDKLEADVKTLEMRMEASQDPATQNLIPVFDSLSKQVEDLRQFHIHHSALPPEFFHTERELLDAQLAALITFELSLKPSGIGGSQSAKTQSTSTANTASKAAAVKPTTLKISGH